MPSLKKKLIIIIAIPSAIFLSVRVLNKVISRFWIRPSLVADKKIEQWPAQLNFKIPVSLRSDQKPELQYFITDSLGALKGHPQRKDVSAWIFGDIRTANLTIPSALRWSSLIRPVSRNFGIPRFNIFFLRNRLLNLFTESNEIPKWIFIGDGIGKWVFLGESKNSLQQMSFRIPDLSPFWIWGQPAVSTPLFEWLCFYWVSPFCDFGPIRVDEPHRKQEKMPRWAGKDLEDRLKLVFEEMGVVRDLVQSKGSKLVGLTIPYAPWEPAWKPMQNTFLRKKFSEIQVPVLDIENRFLSQPAREQFFKTTGAEGGNLTIQGNSFFAEWFDNEVAKNGL